MVQLVSFINRQNMKNYILIASFFVGLTTFGQQQSQFASVFQNPYILNPAAGGLYDAMQIDATTRFQWIGAGQGPTTMMLTGHSQLGIGNSNKNKEFNPSNKVLFSSPEMSVGSTKHIVGGKIYNDEIGVFGRTSVNGSYAIHLPVTSNFNFGAGIGLGWSNFRINQSRVVLYNEGDGTYNDALASSSSQNIADVNAGLVFYGKGLFLGISTEQILKSKAKFNNVATNSNYDRHFYLTAKYSIKVVDMYIEPSVNLKYASNSPLSVDFGSRFIFNGSTWLGAWYRTSNNLVLQVGSNLVKNLYISYTYEQATGKIRNAASGTHEVQLGMYIGRKKAEKKIEPKVETKELEEE